MAAFKVRLIAPLNCEGKQACDGCKKLIFFPAMPSPIVVDSGLGDIIFHVFPYIVPYHQFEMNENEALEVTMVCIARLRLHLG